MVNWQQRRLKKWHNISQSWSRMTARSRSLCPGGCPRWGCWPPWRPSPGLTSRGRRRWRSRWWSTSRVGAGTVVWVTLVIISIMEQWVPPPPWALRAATRGSTGQVWWSLAHVYHVCHVSLSWWVECVRHYLEILTLGGDRGLMTVSRD